MGGEPVYRRLLSNTFLFSVSTFGSKLLLFLLTPFYTSVLSQGEYGVTDLIMQTGNILIPVVSVGITNAVLRFGLDAGSDRRCLFTTGLATVLLGEGVLFLLSPLLQGVGLLSEYTGLILLYVLMANLHGVCSSMAQALDRVRLYAGSGILCTALVVGCNVLLLSVFQLGIVGYVLSNIIADGLATLFLVFALKLWRYLRPASLDRRLVRRMLRYCLPLIPATVCDWVIQVSDRYFLSLLLGPAVSGLYAVSAKVATILLMLASIFTSAWQLSIVSDRSRGEQERFFSNVFSVYEAGVVAGGALLILAAPLVVDLLAAPEYFEAWRCAPLLVLGAVVSCLGAFFASVYMAELRSGATLLTALAGAGANLVGNALLIPRLGAMGAAGATLGAYLVILAARGIHSRRLLRVEWHLPRFLLALGLLGLQCWGMYGGRFPLALACCAGVAALYARPLWRGITTGLRSLKRGG